jgi:hypothetical protein
MDPSTIEFLNSQKRALIDSITTLPAQILTSAAAIGFLTMTVIEMQKVSKRAKFHEAEIGYWLFNDSPFGNLWHGETPLRRVLKIYISIFKRLWNGFYPRKSRGGQEYLDELVQLSTAGNSRALYSLSAENLCGQIGVASQSLLESPNRHKTLLEMMLKSENGKSDYQTDLKTLVEESEKRPSALENNPDPLVAAARNRIAARIQRKIDTLQINVTFRWKEVMRYNSMFYSLLFCGSATLLLSTNYNNWLVMVFVIYITSYVGAFLASVFRDFLGVLEHFKK